MDGSAVSRSHGLSPYRVALDAANQALLAAVSRTPSLGAEVSLIRNREGIVLIEVGGKDESVDGAGHLVQHEFDRLCAAYPYPDGDA